MKTLVLGPLPAEIERFVERRKALGQDTYDEVWEGTYHMSPAARGTHAHSSDSGHWFRLKADIVPAESGQARG